MAKINIKYQTTKILIYSIQGNRI